MATRNQAAKSMLMVTRMDKVNKMKAIRGVQPAMTWVHTVWHMLGNTSCPFIASSSPPSRNSPLGSKAAASATTQWNFVQAEARGLFRGTFLEQWQDYEFRSTHEYRPRNRPLANED